MNFRRTAYRRLSLENCEQRRLLTAMSLQPNGNWTTDLDRTRESASADPTPASITASFTMARAREVASASRAPEIPTALTPESRGNSLPAARQAALEQVDQMVASQPQKGVEVYSVELRRSGVGQVTPSVWESWTAQRNADAFVSRFFPMVDWSAYDTAATTMTGEFNVLQLSEIHSEAAWQVQDNGQARLAWPQGSIVFPTSTERALHQVNESATTIPLVDIDQITAPETTDRSPLGEEIIRLNAGETTSHQGLWPDYPDGRFHLEPSTPTLVPDTVTSGATAMPSLAPLSDAEIMPPSLPETVTRRDESSARSALHSADREKTDLRGSVTWGQMSRREYGLDWGPLPQSQQPSRKHERTPDLRFADADGSARSSSLPQAEANPLWSWAHSPWQGSVDFAWGSSWQPELFTQEPTEPPAMNLLLAETDAESTPRDHQASWTDWLDSLHDLSGSLSSATPPSTPALPITAVEDEAVVSIIPELTADQRWQLDATVTFFEHTPTLDQTVIPQQSELALSHSERRPPSDGIRSQEGKSAIPRIATLVTEFVDVGHLPPPGHAPDRDGMHSLNQQQPHTEPSAPAANPMHSPTGGTYRSSRRLEITTQQTAEGAPADHANTNTVVDTAVSREASLVIRLATPVIDGPVTSITNLTAMAPQHGLPTHREITEPSGDGAFATQVDAGSDVVTHAESLLTSSQLFVIALGTGMYLRRESHIRQQSDRHPQELPSKRAPDRLP